MKIRILHQVYIYQYHAPLTTKQEVLWSTQEISTRLGLHADNSTNIRFGDCVLICLLTGNDK